MMPRGSKQTYSECGTGTSLAVQWLGLHALTVKGPVSIPCWGTKILHAMQHSQKKKTKKDLVNLGTSLAVQWLRLRASTAGGAGSIPGQGTKIPHAVWLGQKKTKRI